jgi:lauroyl/myristoyl acyltransferase
MRINILGANARQLVSAMRQAVEHLKSGGKVLIAVDGKMGRNLLKVPFLGREFEVGRGAAALARLTGAPIIPCAMQWDRQGWGMSVRVFDELPYPDVRREEAEKFEVALLCRLARRFEEYGRQLPGQFEIDQLADLINCPTLVGH